MEAYKIVDTDSGNKMYIWWDGDRIRCSSDRYLKMVLKDHAIGNLCYEDGKPFFDEIPKMFRSGYSYAVKCEVDKDGKEI